MKWFRLRKMFNRYKKRRRKGGERMLKLVDKLGKKVKN